MNKLTDAAQAACTASVEMLLGHKSHFQKEGRADPQTMLSFLSLLCCSGFTGSSNLSFFRSLHLHPAAPSGCSLASNSEGEAFEVCCDSHKPKLLDVPTAKIKPRQIAQFKLPTYPHHR